MKEKKLFESFNWVVPFEVGNRKGKKVIIRGQALFPLVSRNLRKYIEEELVRSARTLANGYIDVNHEYSLWAATQEGHKPHLKGNIIDAEFEDGAIEYVGQVNHPEYFAKLIDGDRLSEEAYFEKYGKKPIRHVSVDAIYRFHNAGEDWEGIEPRGIRFNGLSMVEDPEVPGVAGTTLEVVEIRETLDNPQFKILQNYFKDIGVSTEIMEKDGKLILDVREDKTMKISSDRTNPDEIKKMMEQEEEPAEEEPCPEGQRRNDEGECVPIEEEPIAEQEEEPERKCPEGQVWDDDKGECVPKEEIATEYFRLGEPFADYTDFDDCVSKNSDKDDPEAYCAQIKRQTEGETLEQRQARELKELREKQRWEKLNVKFNTFTNQLKEVQKFGKRINQLETKLDKITKSQEKTLKETMSSAHTEIHELQHSITQVKDKIESLMVGEEERAEIRSMFKEYQEKAENELKEILDKFKRFEEEFDSVKTHVKPNLKGEPGEKLTETAPKPVKPVPDPIKG